MRRLYWKAERRHLTDCTNLIPLKEYARLKNVSDDTVRRSLMAHDIEGYKKAGRWYVRHEP